MGLKVDGEAVRNTAREDKVTGVPGRRRNERKGANGSDDRRLQWEVQLLAADSVDGALVFVLVREHGGWHRRR